MTVTASTDLCPRCDIGLVAEEDKAPWCARCEWNLDAYAPPEEWPWYRRSMARLDHRYGFRADLRLATADATPGSGVGFIVLCAVSVVLVAVPLAALIGGLCLIVWHRHNLDIVLGVILLPVAYALRPRLGRVRRYLRGKYQLDPQATPALHELIDRVATATGAPRPDIVAFHLYSWSASVTVLGVRGRRILTLGVPLLAGLRPEELVALLGHELGHLANKDSRRSLLTLPARVTFGHLSAVLRPSRADALDLGLHGSLAVIYELWRLATGTLSWLFFGVHLGINIIGSGYDRRAEQRADLVAARAGGTAATLSLLDATAGAPVYGSMISGATGAGVALHEWQTDIAASRARNADRIPLLRQLTIREEASLFATHPTTGRRHQFLAARPPQLGAVALTEPEARKVFREIAPYAERLRLDLAEQYEM